MTPTTHFLLPADPLVRAGDDLSGLCGQPLGPVDLRPYKGRVSCQRCNDIGARFFSAAGDTRLR